MTAEGRWKCRAVDAEENQQQVSLSAHRPWKSLRDSHIPTAPMTIPLFDSDKKRGPGGSLRSRRWPETGAQNRNFLLCRE